MHHFSVTEPANGYGTGLEDDADETPPANPEQLMAIKEITDVLQSIATRCVGRDALRDALSNETPFLLLEMHKGIASLLGVREHCWVMLELSGRSPTVLFEDRDVVQLKRKDASELQEAASALHH